MDIVTDRSTYPPPSQAPAPRYRRMLWILISVVVVGLAIGVSAFTLVTQVTINTMRTEYTETYRDYMDAYTELESAKTEAKIVSIELYQKDIAEPELLIELERLDAAAPLDGLVDKLPGAKQGDHAAVKEHTEQLALLSEQHRDDAAAILAAVEAVRGAEGI